MTTATRRPRLALYARTSTAKDQSPAMQLDALRLLAAQRGWEAVEEYVDVGHSGAKEKRPALDRLMKDAMKGRLDIVICWRFDRFARSVKHLVLTLEEFRARGIEFLSVQGGIDTSTPAGRFTFHVIAAVAELERELIRERVRAGLESARARGTKLGRPRKSVDVDRLKALQGEGLSLRRIAAETGLSASSVARALAS